MQHGIWQEHFWKIFEYEVLIRVKYNSPSNILPIYSLYILLCFYQKFYGSRPCFSQHDCMGLARGSDRLLLPCPCLVHHAQSGLSVCGICDIPNMWGINVRCHPRLGLKVDCKSLQPCNVPKNGWIILGITS